MALNRELLKLAESRTKQSFVAPGPGGGAPPMDPSMMGGGMPPMDPSMMGGGAPPPMDPSMMGGGGAPDMSGGGGMDPSMMGGGGGMPPMDPSMMGGLPPLPPPPPPPSDPGSSGGSGDIRSAIRDELASAGLLPNGNGKGGKQAKPDINTIATDVFQLKKMFLHFLRIQGIDLPMDILDGPNRDPMTGAPAVNASGGSDVKPGSSGTGEASSAIKPIEPMPGAFPSAGEKTSADLSVGRGIRMENMSVPTKAAYVANMFRKRI